jgi:HTH-type transcriptional regulator/antitoxin HigA
MAQREPAEVFPPGDYLVDEMLERGWSRADLIRMSGLSGDTVDAVLDGRRKVTVAIASHLAAAFGTSVEVWCNLQRYYDKYKAPE